MKKLPTAFDAAVDFVLAEEGGLVDHPSDPGGITYKGVSLRAVVGLRDVDGELEFDLDDDGDVDAADIRLLKNTPVLIRGFYHQHYWKASRANVMPWPVSLCLFDASVNHGPRPAIAMLQRAAGVKADGIVGPKTLDAVNAAPIARPALIRRYLVERSWLYHRLSAKNGGVFHKGWMKRLFDLQAECFRLVRPL